jgi:hypothetical protein
MPGDHASVELQDFGCRCPQLAAESRKTRAGHLREPAVSCFGDDFQQLLDTSAPEGDDNPELGKDKRGLN